MATGGYSLELKTSTVVCLESFILIEEKAYSVECITDCLYDWHVWEILDYIWPEYKQGISNHPPFISSNF